MFDQIAAMIADQLGKDVSEIKPESRLIEDLKADSLDVVELTMALEEEFELPDTPEEELTGIVTVGDLAAYVTRAIQG